MQFFFAHHYVFLLTFLFFMAILAGFVDAIAGGGGLISLPALMYTGLPMTMVIGTNKFQGAFSLIVATYKYYKNGMIDFSMIYRGLLMGLIGAASGAIVVNHVSSNFMRFVIPFLLLLIFLVNIFNRSLGIKPGQKILKESTFFAIFGFVLGFYDAFFGPGAGNLWVMSIVFFIGYTFLQASGYAKVLNLKSCLFSIVFFIYYQQIDFSLGAVMALGQFIGGYLGAHMVILRGSEIVKPFFMVVVFINILVLFYQMLFN